MSESRTNVIRVIIVTLATLVLLPAVTLAQDGAIAGVVKDTSGAVLPGVTVEASSPALIEKVRTVTSDGEGQYKIVDLRPGDYVVTFTLGGFSTLKREGIRLTTGFTAAVNVNLAVGSLEETVTVSSQSPVCARGRRSCDPRRASGPARVLEVSASYVF